MSIKALIGTGIVIMLSALLGYRLYFSEKAATGNLQVTNPDWFSGYAGQSVNELLSLEGSYRIDSLVSAFEEAINQKAARTGDERLSVEERVVLAVEALEREVNNGGYNQFFFNSSRRYASVIVESLQRIGCPQTAQITQNAINALRVPNLTAETIRATIERENEVRGDELDRYDKMYYQAGEDIEGRLFEFIKANKKSISF